MKTIEIPKYSNIKQLKNSIENPLLLIEIFNKMNSFSMSQHYSKLINDLSDTPKELEIKNLETIKKKITKKIIGNAAIVTLDKDLSLDLNCKSFSLASAINAEGMIQIKNNIYKVDIHSVELIEGKILRNSEDKAFFFEHGYHEIITKEKKQNGSIKKLFVKLNLVKTVTKKRYRAILTVKEYTGDTTIDGKSYCEVVVIAKQLNWFWGAPVFTQVHVQTISIGGAFSGPHTPSTYYLGNPFNHVVRNNCMTFTQAHWKDDSPFYQVFSCMYDASVYYYDGYRLDVDVSK